MTNEELQTELLRLKTELNELKDVYYRTNYIDRSVFSNPVYLTKVIIPTIAGAPTSVPDKATLIYDTTNNKIYVYNGAWKSVSLT